MNFDAHVIIAGQSNPLGFKNDGPAPYNVTVRVQIWTDTNGDGRGDAWNYMNPGVNTGTPNNPTVWGIEVGIANEWLSHNADGYLWIAKDWMTVRGQTGLAEDPNALDWSPASRGEMFDLSTASIDAARANLVGGPYAFATWDKAFWFQGETDAMDAAKAAAYGPNLTGFIGAARPAWDVTDFVVARIDDNAVTMPHNLAVRQAEWAVDQADDHVVSVKTLDFERQDDGLHLTAAGQIDSGRALADAAWLF